MGRMQISVPPGAHRVEATFERTPVRWVADVTSLAAFVALCLAWPRRKNVVR
jgi:hypothetical protein